MNTPPKETPGVHHWTNPVKHTRRIPLDVVADCFVGPEAMRIATAQTIFKELDREGYEVGDKKVTEPVTKHD